MVDDFLAYAAEEEREQSRPDREQPQSQPCTRRPEPQAQRLGLILVQQQERPSLQIRLKSRWITAARRERAADRGRAHATEPGRRGYDQLSSGLQVAPSSAPADGLCHA